MLVPSNTATSLEVGTTLPDQFAAVLQLLSPPSPSQVRFTALVLCSEKKKIAVIVVSPSRSETVLLALRLPAECPLE